MRYTRGYIMQLISGILFPDASDSRVHIRWLPQLENLDACGRLSWGSAVLAWLYRQMCRTTEHGQRNLGGCVSLMLSWAYHRISLVRPDGFDARRFPLVERWVQYRPDNATDERRLRQYRRTLNGVGMLNIEWTPYADSQLFGLVAPAIAEADASAAVVYPLLCFAIVEWHQVDRVWAHTELFGLGDQHLVPDGVVPEDLPMHHPLAPDLHQPEDGHLPELRPAAGGGRDRGRERGRGEADAAEAMRGRIPRRYPSKETLSSRQLTVPTMQARRLDHCQVPC
ncbi:hypothetical protein AHAS_Ahas15G0301200 [Arachis hypogaea]